MRHKMIVLDGLKGCPLCGTSVQMDVYGGLFLDAPGETLPIYNARTAIKCPTEFLTLDLEWRGYADAEGKTEEEQLTMLDAIMGNYAEKAKEIWNGRADHV